MEEGDERVHPWNVDVDLAISVLMHGRITLRKILLHESIILGSLALQSRLEGRIGRSWKGKVREGKEVGEEEN